MGNCKEIVNARSKSKPTIYLEFFFVLFAYTDCTSKA